MTMRFTDEQLETIEEAIIDLLQWEETHPDSRDDWDKLRDLLDKIQLEKKFRGLT